ncbi:MAG: electron transfer flavoprotein-ubiquinone oxidoreductase [Gammaproteobacteria bacterium]
MTTEHLTYDILIIGAGPAGLSAGIRIKQKNPALTVAILEKGAEIGAHIISGAVFNPRALNLLFMDWQAQGAPLLVPAAQDQFLYLSEQRYFPLPTLPSLNNQGNYIISLANLCRWLGTQAEQLGVDIFPGFPADKILYDEQGAVCGVKTKDQGINKEGEKTARYQPGVEIYAKQCLLGEGCRGSLSEEIIAHFSLRQDCDPQTYGLGIKEIWEIPEKQHVRGKVIHTIGWPLDSHTYGGGFLYHLDNNQVALGFIVGLDYQNPYLDPYEELQRWKTHPAIKEILKDGQRISYGARALNEGGYQAIPKLTFPGGMLIGCAAGFMNVLQLKGSHNAMESGILAADVICEQLQSSGQELKDYQSRIMSSHFVHELYLARNIHPAMQKGLWRGLAYAALDAYIFHGRTPWTWHSQADNLQLKPASQCKKITYPAHDNQLTFDKLTSVYYSNTQHNEDQPSHLQLKDPAIFNEVNLPLYAAPEQRYCPAGVYEVVYSEDGTPRLVINAGNCVHCKTCDIKDPKQNIHWACPEGGGGPNYGNM